MKQQQRITTTVVLDEDIIRQMQSDIPGNKNGAPVHHKKARPIDTLDDDYMVNVGLRRPHIDINRDIHIKDENERKALKNAKANVEVTEKEPQVKFTTNERGNLKLHVENKGTLDVNAPKHQQKRYFKTTYAYNNINKSDISYFIDTLTKKGNTITKQYWKGEVV